MNNQNPVLFYFNAHNVIEEQDTPVLRCLVKRTQVLFLEGASSDIPEEMTTEIERDINDYSQRRIISPRFQKLLQLLGQNSPTSILTSLTQGTSKRYVVERGYNIPFDPFEWDQQCRDIYFDNGLKPALDELRKYLEENEKYQTQREGIVSKQILEIPETTLVIFGASHRDLERIVSQSRPTEVHFPYQDYPNRYDIQLIEDFKQSKEANEELFIRGYMESIARKAIRNKYRSTIERRILELAAHNYATIMTSDQIKGYVHYLKFNINFGITEPSEIFETYIRRENLPSIEEVIGKIPKE